MNLHSLQSPAPIVLFVFARPAHTQRTLDALAANGLADQSDLIVYADAARNTAEAGQVQAVRTLIRSTRGFRSVTLVERASNYGLARNIIEGVTETCARCGRVIVLEDDLVTSPHFLRYMNEALNRYADEEQVVSIHGYVYPVAQPLPEAFFLPGADCWGWATWQRGWACFIRDGKHLLDELRRRNLVGAFDYNGAYPYSKMLAQQIRGKNDSWAIRWYASALLAGKLTLYPGRSLVHNIGTDNSGTHCGDSNLFVTELSDRPIDLHGVDVRESKEGRRAFEVFFRQHGHGIIGKIARRSLRWLNGMILRDEA